MPDYRLKTGDVGTVIHVHKKGEAFEVEFLTLQGETVATATLEASQVRPVQKREITHARLLAGIVKFYGVGQNQCSSQTRKTVWKP